MKSLLTVEIETYFSVISFRLWKEHNCDNSQLCSILGKLFIQISIKGNIQKQSIFAPHKTLYFIQGEIIISLSVAFLGFSRKIYEQLEIFCSLIAKLEGVVQLAIHFEALYSFVLCLKVGESCITNRILNLYNFL